MPSALYNILESTLGPSLLPIMGVDVTVTPQSGPAIQIRAIQIPTARRSEVDQPYEVYWMRLADCPSIARGSGFHAESVQYTVFEVQPDQAGGAYIALQR